MVKSFFTLFIAIHFLSPLYVSAMDSEKLNISSMKAKRKPIIRPSVLSFDLFKEIVTFGSLLTTEGEYEVEDLPLVLALFNYLSSPTYEFNDLKTSCRECILSSRGAFSLDKYEYLMIDLEEPTRLIENPYGANAFPKYVSVPGRYYGFGLIKKN
jgi:hypothetical protein